MKTIIRLILKSKSIVSMPGMMSTITTLPTGLKTTTLVDVVALPAVEKNGFTWYGGRRMTFADGSGVQHG